MSTTPSEMSALEPIAAIDNAWDMLWVSAQTHAGAKLDRERVMSAAVDASRGSSWNPLEYLLAWDSQICETGRLPAALVGTVEEGA